ncbi:hypothetical protein ANO11243_077100 [Dothideomycetidae sp. 11243]|nr:hypothetical protein ANO11243_077100 [fungal sp. No.11243]
MTSNGAAEEIWKRRARSESAGVAGQRGGKAVIEDSMDGVLSNREVEVACVSHLQGLVRGSAARTWLLVVVVVLLLLLLLLCHTHSFCGSTSAATSASISVSTSFAPIVFCTL